MSQSHQHRSNQTLFNIIEKKIIPTQTVKKCPRGKQTSSLETIKSRNSERKISEQTQTSLKASLNSIFSAPTSLLVI